MIELKNVSVNVNKKRLISGVNLRVNKYDHVVLTGHSGCGKSTLLKLFAGGCLWDEGIYTFKNMVVSAKNIFPLRHCMGYAGQEYALAGGTVREGLQELFSFRAYRHRPFPEEYLMQLMQKFFLDKSLLLQSPADLSGGQRQRFAIIRMLLPGPELILADEPTSALDARSKDAVIKALIRPDHTLISVSHDDDWIKCCNRVIRLDEGKIIEGGN